MAYHTYLTLVIPAVIALAITMAATLFLMPYLRGAGVVVVDYNKKEKRVLPGGCGIAVAFGFAVGALAYVFGASFSLYPPVLSTSDLFAAVIAVLFVSLSGFIDDINVKAKPVKTTGMLDTKQGLKQWQKPLLTFIGAIPLMAVNAGVSSVSIPFIGIVNLGLLWPLVVLPLAVMFASNAVNLLGGFDGIANGTGLIASAGLLAYSIIFGSYTGSLISGTLFASLLGFMVFNTYPSRLIPGDSFTYATGIALATAIIIGDMDAFGLVIFTPWIVEFLLHLRRRFNVTDLGRRRSNGTFAAPYGRRIYSWTHAIMNLRPMKEWEVTAVMCAVEAAFVALGFALKLLSLL